MLNLYSQNMYKLLKLIVLSLIFGCNLYSQINDLDTDLNKFNQIISNNSEIVSPKNWEYLRIKAVQNSRNYNFNKAQEYSKKAIIIAEILKDDLLLARSYHLLGNAFPNSNDHKETRISNFLQSINTIAGIEKSNNTRKIVGYIFNDLAAIYLDPEFVRSNNERKPSAKGLSEILKMIEKFEEFDFLDLEVKTFINISKYFYLEGHIPAQLIWLEKANKLNQENKTHEDFNFNQYDILFNLQRAYRRIGDYQKAFELLAEIKNLLNNYPNDYLNLEYLRQLESANSDIFDLKTQWKTLEEAIELSSKLNYRKGEFLTIKLLNLLLENKIAEARKLFDEIKNDKSIVFENLDRVVIEGSLAGFENNESLSDKYFAEAEKILEENLQNEWMNKIFLLHKQLRVAQHLKRYEKSRLIGEAYLKTAEENKNKDSFPFILIELAKAEIALNNTEKAKERIQEAIKFIEEKRQSGSAIISVRVMELLYEAYQLKITLNKQQNKIEDLLESSEALKSRWLFDKISNNSKISGKFKVELTEKILEESLRVIDDPQNKESVQNLNNLEKEAIFSELKENKFNSLNKAQLFESFDKISFKKKTAIISYNFTSDNKLLAVIFRPDKPLESINLDLTNSQVNALVELTHKQIKNSQFFKQRSQELYNSFLKPLKVEDIEHLIIIPDRAIWRLPFQAFSEDGKNYLIENKLISYAPSVSILIKQLINEIPVRNSFQVFANSKYKNFLLKFAELEANELAKIFGVNPNKNATVSQFIQNSRKSDILHFSMHSEIEEEPFNSFLAFNPDDYFKTGNLTVKDLLNINLKPQSLVFLASCSTDNIFTSEGLVSLSWGMFGSGATSVISAQWAANDESTAQFTKSFYKNYKTGLSAAEALQKAAIEMINSEFSKPFYWAEFILNGDFR